MQNNQTPERISGKQLWRNFKDAYDIERGWIYTFRELTLRPGKLLKQYIEGDRRLVNPIKYALMAITITVIAQLLESLIYPSSEVYGPSNVQEQVENYIFPLLAALSISIVLYLLNLKKGYNYFEYFIMVIFSFSHAMLLIAIIWDIVLVQLYHLFGINDYSLITDVTAIVTIGLLLIYMFWVIKVFLNIGVWRTLLNVLVSQVLLIVSMFYAILVMDKLFTNEYTYVGLSIVDSEPRVMWTDVVDRIEVKALDPAGPASKAGIQPGDVILKINNERVYSNSFYESLSRYDPGETIVVTLLRDGKEIELAVHLLSHNKLE